jgi:hypothetical protein
VCVRRRFTITFFDFKPYEKAPFENANKKEAQVPLSLVPMQRARTWTHRLTL